MDAWPFVAVFLAAYTVHVFVWPLKACRRCGGSGKAYSPVGSFYRPCGRCEGRGWRVRPARAVLGYMRRPSEIGPAARRFVRGMVPW